MKLLIVFSICISATVVFLILLFNISNTTYYRSHEEIDVIVAGGKKDLKSFKYAESLSYIQIHNNNEQLLKQFDDLEILIKNNDEIFLIKLMDIKTNDLKNFQINNELLALTEGQTLQGEPVVQNVNGFKMDVVVDENSKQGFGEGVLYSRYAVAKNSTGIVILKGEPSFSADPQILIDELSFYIRNNNLKAD